MLNGKLEERYGERKHCFTLTKHIYSKCLSIQCVLLLISWYFVTQYIDKK